MSLLQQQDDVAESTSHSSLSEESRMMTHSYWFGSKLILGQLPRCWAIGLPLQDDVAETTSDSGVREQFAKLSKNSRITTAPNWFSRQ